VDAFLTRQFATGLFSWRSVLALIVPVVISQFFIIGFFALAPLMIAGTGIEAIAAVSTIEYLNVFVLSVFVALAAAGSVLVAQYAGHGEPRNLYRAGAATIWATVVPAALVGGAIVIFHGPLLDAFLGPAGDAVVGFGRVYLIASAISYPANAMVEAASACLRAVAHTRASLSLTVTMNGGFLATAALLIYVFGLGVEGLSAALIAGRYAAAVLAVWLLRRDNRLGPGLHHRPQAKMIRRVLFISLPFLAEQVLFNGGKLVIQWFVVALGTAQMTINAVGSSIVAFCDVVPQALCVAIVPLVGQAVGAGKLKDARRLIRSFTGLALVVAVLGTLATLACYDWLLSLYQTPPELDGGVWAIFWVASAGRLTLVWALSFLIPSGLRAAGDTVFATVVASACMCFRVAAAWVVGVWLGFGAVGVWIAMVAEWLIRGVIFTIRYLGRRWETHSFVA
jgi:Na+-driven multidrug efflux pump